MCFGGKLMRGNRTQKVDSSAYQAFDSPSYPPLAELGVNVDWAHRYLLQVGPAPALPPVTCSCSPGRCQKRTRVDIPSGTWCLPSWLESQATLVVRMPCRFATPSLQMEHRHAMVSAPIVHQRARSSRQSRSINNGMGISLLL